MLCDFGTKINLIFLDPNLETKQSFFSSTRNTKLHDMIWDMIRNFTDFYMIRNFTQCNT